MNTPADTAPLVHLVDLVCFAYLASFVQPNKQDTPNSGLLMLADFFSILPVT
jgi:hypothetical protein